MSKPFRLGFLTHVEGAGDPRRIYQDTLAWFTTADQLGFDVGWLAEHHFKMPNGRLPSLFPFIAVAGERTQHIRLGTSIIILPVQQPLRVAEDAAVVDVLTGGRLELGLGSGGDPVEFQAFGVDLADRHHLTTSGVQLIQRALRGERLNERGQVLQPPAPTLADRIWQSALSVTGVQHLARQGAGLLLSRAAWANNQPTDVAQVPVVQAYVEACRENGVPARVGLSRGIYPAADKRTALAQLREPVMRTAEAQIHAGNYPVGITFEECCARMHIYYGHPDEIAAEISADKILPYATDLILQFNPATPPLDEALRMLEQIATQIAPALGWQPHAHQPLETVTSTI